MRPNYLTQCIYLFILCSSYGCLPQVLQQSDPAPLKTVPQATSDTQANTKAVAELATITKTEDGYNSFKTLSPEEQRIELAQIIESQNQDTLNPEKLILLTLASSPSSDQLATAKKLLTETNVDSTLTSASSKKLLTLLLDLARERVALLDNIEQTSQKTQRLQEKKNQLENNLSLCEKKTTALLEQIKKLEEIEKIIIKRKKAVTLNR